MSSNSTGSGGGGIRFNAHFGWGAPTFRTKEEQLQHDLDVALDRLRAITEVPGVFASVIEVGEKHVTICTGPQKLSVRKPRAMEGLEPGVVVRLTPPTNEGSQPAIALVVKDPPATGAIVTVKQVIDENTLECQGGPVSKIVYYRPSIEPETGDRIVLDLTETVVARNLGKADKSRVFAQSTGVTWDDVGGQDEAKRELIEIIEEPVKHKELYEKYRKRPTRGALLYGPPGNGKTLLAKAAATSLANTYGSDVGGFLYVKGPDILNMFVGNSELAIRQLFSAAREHKAASGFPALLFIDEGDAVLGKRGLGFREGMERTIVPQFLSEMDGLEDAGCFVLIATNRPDTLDPAIVRPGRVDVKVHVKKPDAERSKIIFGIHMKGFPIAKGTSRDELIDVATETLFDDKHALYVVRCKDGKDQRFALREVVSGALIETVVQRSAQRAFRRERDGQSPKGVTTEDVKQTIRDFVSQYRDLDHTEAIRTFIEEKKLEVTGIEPVR